jgi:hypothetical protein
MPIAAITKQGLAAIGIAVGLLWGCAIGERLMSQRALSERALVMREVVRLQRQRQRPEPVSAPALVRPHRVRVNAG